MRHQKFLIVYISILFSQALFADCAVLGVHEPNSNTYDGPTWCKEVELSNLTVRGPTQIQESCIHGLVDVSGPVNLSQSNISGVLIEDNLSSNTVTISNQTKIIGNIVFLGKTGKVVIDHSSKINGKVINGVINHVNHE